MKNFVGFGIGTSRYEIKNILGNTVEEVKEYYIYKYWFWGLFRIPLKFSCKKGWKIAYHVSVMYTSELTSSKFDSIYECEQLIQDMKNNPNKYIIN